MVRCRPRARLGADGRLPEGGDTPPRASARVKRAVHCPARGNNPGSKWRVCLCAAHGNTPRDGTTTIAPCAEIGHHCPYHGASGRSGPPGRGFRHNAKSEGQAHDASEHREKLQADNHPRRTPDSDDGTGTRTNRRWPATIREEYDWLREDEARARAAACTGGPQDGPTTGCAGGGALRGHEEHPND